MIEQTTGWLLVLAPAVLVSLLVSLALIVLPRAWLARLALARANARSSHQPPTPQGAQPLYHRAAATLTLARRLVRGEPFWQAQRMHVYQLATDRGFTVSKVVAGVFGASLALAALALLSLAIDNVVASLAALGIAAAIGVGLPRQLAAGRQ